MTEDELETLIDKLIRKVWAEKGMPDQLTPSLIRYYADQFWDAIMEGYGNDITSFDTDTPDYVMLQKLQENVWHFSAAKNYSQLKSMSDALIGPDGRLREFNDFKREAYLISQDHKGPWLQAEYNLAVSSSQMAAKWVMIGNDRDLFPSLVYDAVLDGRTTQTCRSLDGVTLPIDHPFWNTWYPPNHWGCRSMVQQTDSDKVTPDSEINYPENIPDMFKRNFAKDGLVFPEGHPYYTDNPNQVKSVASKLQRKYGRR